MNPMWKSLEPLLATFPAFVQAEVIGDREAPASGDEDHALLCIALADFAHFLITTPRPESDTRLKEVFEKLESLTFESRPGSNGLLVTPDWAKTRFLQCLMNSCKNPACVRPLLSEQVAEKWDYLTKLTEETETADDG